MAQQQQASKQSNSNDDLTTLVQEAVETFRSENPEAYEELVKAFDGKSADLALLGHQKFHVSVMQGNFQIEPDVVRGGASTGRGAIAPETLVAIVEGKLTPLEAFFKGDLIARANSADLHVTYDYFVKFSEAALRSERLQVLLVRFREMIKV